MRNTLIIANAFPPHAGTEASRMAQLAKYLPETGWLPHVVCSEWTPGNCPKYDPQFGSSAVREFVVRRIPAPRDLTTPRTLADRWQKVCRLLAGYANPRQWTGAAIKAGRQVLSERSIDVILATFPFRGALHVADVLSRESGVPWVADFRDVLEESCPEWSWAWERRNERRAVRSASLITTVTPALVQVLAARHGREVRLLPNGFDPDDFAEVAPKRLQKFTILYAGSLHPPGSQVRASPRMLFEAVDWLVEKGQLDLEQIELRFLGATEAKLQPHLVGTKCQPAVQVDEWVSRAEVVSWEKGAHVLLLLGSSHMKGILTAKIFEYLAARRRILAIPADADCIDELLHRSQAGAAASSAAEIAAILAGYHEQWLRDRTVRCDSKEAVIDEFSRRHQARALAKWLEEVSKTK